MAEEKQDETIELMERTPVPKAYVKLAYPVVVGMLVTIVYGLVDTYFVGLTGDENMVAGVSLITPIYTLLVAFGDIFGIGSSSLISRYLGERNLDMVRRTSSFSFWSSLVLGLVATAALLLFRDPVMGLLGATEATWPHAMGYYVVLCCGSASVVVSFVSYNTLRADGHATDVLIGNVIGTVLNLALDPALILGAGLGAWGAAIATVCGSLAQTCYYLFATVKKSKYLSISPKDAKLPGKDILGLLAIGIPASLTNLAQAFMLAITNNYLAPYGSTAVAAMGIVSKVTTFSFLVLTGIAFGGQPLFGYTFGAKDFKRLRESIRFAFALAIGVGVVFTVVAVVFSSNIVALIMNDPEVVDIGAKLLFAQVIATALEAVVLVSSCVCLSIGDAMGPLVLSISRQGIIYLIAITIMSSIFDYEGVIYAQAVADVITAAMAVVLVWRVYSKKLKPLEAQADAAADNEA